MNRFALVFVFAACGGNDSGDDGVDAPVAPAMIVVTGVADEVAAIGGGPAEGVLVEAFANSAETTVLAMATTDAAGAYTLTIPTGGVALDGFLKATKAGLVETYLYPPRPLAEDFDGASLKMISPGTFDALDTFCSANRDETMGAIAMLVVDAANMPVASATVSSNPAATKTCYNGSNGLPDRMAMATASDGVGYLFNVTGTATVSGTATGLTLLSHQVKARGGALTTTVIQP